MRQTDMSNGHHPSPVALLIDCFGRVNEMIPAVVSGVSTEGLLWRPDTDANSIAWLVWHLTRVADDHIAGIANSSQVWLDEGWMDRFRLPYPDDAIGFGQTSKEVGAFTVEDASLLVHYWDATFTRTSSVLSGLREDDLERVVDDSYDPPVTVAVRLVSVVNDITQHVGQAAYVRGLVRRRPSARPDRH